MILHDALRAVHTSAPCLVSESDIVRPPENLASWRTLSDIHEYLSVIHVMCEEYLVDGQECSVISSNVQKCSAILRNIHEYLADITRILTNVQKCSGMFRNI